MELTEAILLIQFIISFIIAYIIWNYVDYIEDI